MVAQHAVLGKRRNRGHGAGTIKQRADGRWEAQLSLPGGKRKSVYGRTRREVQDKLTAALRDVQQGLPLPDGRTTVRQFLARWLEDSARPGIRPSTFASYETLIRVHIAPALGGVALAALTPQHVQRFLNEKLQAGVSPRRVQMMRAVLRSALNQALTWGMVPRNAAALAPSPRVVRPDVPVLTPAGAQELIAGIRGDPLEALYIAALGTGLRQGELLGLRWRDIDFDTVTITVRAQLQRVRGEWRLMEPKTARARRTLGVDPMVVEALREHRVRQFQDRLLAGSRWRDPIPDLVFRNGVGNPLDAPTVTHRFQRALERAGLPRMRFHDLRHGAASLLLSQGVHPRVVMEQLGHSQISLTMNTYAHVASELQRDAARRLGSILGGVSG